MRWIVFLYPWLELWSLLALGSRTSAGMAMLWVLGAGVLGVIMIRVAGAQTLGQLRTAQQSGSLQAQLLQDHVALAIVGLLLLIPGMVSDLLAVLVLIRPIRLIQLFASQADILFTGETPRREKYYGRRIYFHNAGPG